MLALDLAAAGVGDAPWPSTTSRVEIRLGWGVRVLLATTARDDHLGTLVVFGIACHRFGHEVVAAPELFAAAVQRAGFAHAPFATPVPAVRDAVSAEHTPNAQPRSNHQADLCRCPRSTHGAWLTGRPAFSCRSLTVPCRGPVSG
jgi:hypothetical protein